MMPPLPLTYRFCLALVFIVAVVVLVLADKLPVETVWPVLVALGLQSPLEDPSKPTVAVSNPEDPPPGVDPGHPSAWKG